jgi:hypothetical protein
MTVVISEPFFDKTARRLQGPCRYPLQAGGEIAAGAKRFVILLLLGLICTFSSVAFVLSSCIAMPVLTEQFASWLKNGQWQPMPLAMLLAKMGYVPSVNASPSKAIIDWFFSFETGFVFVAAAAAFACTVWMFERARSVLTPPLLSATGAGHMLASGCAQHYPPETHYMRGPAPKWRAKHVQASIEG